MLWRAQYSRENIVYRTATLPAYLKTRADIAQQMQHQAALLKTCSDFYGLSLEVDKIYAIRTLNQTAAETRQTQQLLKHRLLKTKSPEPLFRSFQLEMLSKLYQMERNQPKAFACAKENLQLLEKFPAALQLNTQTYFTAVHAYTESRPALLRTVPGVAAGSPADRTMGPTLFDGGIVILCGQFGPVSLE